MVPWVNGQKGTVEFYALDLPSSNVRGLFNASSALTARYEYGPFGEPHGASGTNQPLRFAARELDATAGLYYVRARWYDASMGRFISEDPIGLAGGINNYAYAANNPVNLSDPTGLDPCRRGELRNGHFRCGQVLLLQDVGTVAWHQGFFTSMIDRSFNGDGVTHSMSGVAFATSPGWQDRSDPKEVPEDESGVLARVGRCALDHYGLGALVGATGAAAVAAGAPVLRYPRSGVDAGRSTGRTSLLSKWARRIPGEFASEKWAPTLKNLGATTISKGGMAARWIPWIGGAMLVVDTAFITACVVSS
jgi:RHS repeat-associated protein